MTVKTTHVAKPHVPLTIGSAWTDIEGVIGSKKRKRFYTLRRKGWLTVRLYLPGHFTGHELAKLEWRVVREPFGKLPMDPTAYDYRVLLPGDKDVRASFIYTGPMPYPGRLYKVQARVVGGGTYVTTGTHYIDYRQIA